MIVIAPGSALAPAQAASEQVALAGLVDASAECFIARHQPVDTQPAAGAAGRHVRRIDPDQAGRPPGRPGGGLAADLDNPYLT